MFLHQHLVGQDTPIEEILTQAENLVSEGSYKDARTQLAQLPSRLTPDQLYRRQLLARRVYRNQLSLSHELLAFRPEYPVTGSWNSLAVEYKRLIAQTSVIGRVSYARRFDDTDLLYELESYPVFSNRFYSYVNVSVGQARFYQQFGASASAYYSLSKGYELEAGFRYLRFRQVEFTSIIGGVTKYIGRFYLNTRAYLGPRDASTLIQNYQLNVRYYLHGPEEYLSLRLGTGISPDDRNRWLQVKENPNLNALYATVGIHKVWEHTILMLQAGYLHEQLTSNRDGRQWIVASTLRYRF